MLAEGNSNEHFRMFCKEDPSLPWMCRGLHTLLLTTPAGDKYSPLEVVLYRRTCNSLTAVVPSDQTILETVSTILMVAETFTIDYETGF